MSIHISGLIPILVSLFYIIPYFNANIHRKCLISQYSSDGFGHQIEGKFSCLLVQYLIPNFTYVHIPFEKMQHTPHLVAQAEIFGGIGNRMIPSIKHPEFSRYYRKRVNDSWLGDAALNPGKCESEVIYVLDNCWKIIYNPPLVYKLNESTDFLRRIYFSTPKTDYNPKFNTSRINIAVHIRRGDARARMMSLE